MCFSPCTLEESRSLSFETSVCEQEYANLALVELLADASAGCSEADAEAEGVWLAAATARADETARAFRRPFSPYRCRERFLPFKRQASWFTNASAEASSQDLESPPEGGAAGVLAIEVAREAARCSLLAALARAKQAVAAEQKGGGDLRDRLREALAQIREHQLEAARAAESERRLEALLAAQSVAARKQEAERSAAARTARTANDRWCPINSHTHTQHRGGRPRDARTS